MISALKRQIIFLLLVGVSAWGQSVDDEIMKNLDFFMKLDLVRTQEMLNASKINLATQTSKEQPAKQALKDVQSEKN